MLDRILVLIALVLFVLALSITDGRGQEDDFDDDDMPCRIVIIVTPSGKMVSCQVCTIGSVTFVQGCS